MAEPIVPARDIAADIKCLLSPEVGAQVPMSNWVYGWMPGSTDVCMKALIFVEGQLCQSPSPPLKIKVMKIEM